MQTIYFDNAAGSPGQSKEDSNQPAKQTNLPPQPKLSLATNDLNEEAVSACRDTKPKADIPKSVRARLNGAAQTRLFQTPSNRRFVFRPSTTCWLTVAKSGRHISLPDTGELILGRFDPHIISPLDVDLTFEDREAQTVSRRHARIVGTKGYHTIEDMGSSNGLFINGIRVKAGQSQPLQPGDHITIGELEIFYEPVPEEFLNITTPVNNFLMMAHNGQKFAIEPPNSTVIGRSDPWSNLMPNIDLSEDDDIAAYVSRCHASITWSGHKPYLRDLDSSFGTRLNGELLMPNRTVALKAGDHISLGGCVLVYCVEEIHQNALTPAGAKSNS